MFQLTEDETDNMVSQNAIPSKSHLGGALPYVFTEYGTLMISSILNSDIAIQINQTIIKAFVEIRKQIATDPSYELLKEKVKRIEAEMKEIKATQLVESQIISGKLTNLSSEVRNLSDILDKFQGENIIIKRPEEGEKNRVDMLIGYAQVSSIDQNLDLQIDALKQADWEKIEIDKVGKEKRKHSVKRYKKSSFRKTNLQFEANKVFII